MLRRERRQPNILAGKLVRRSKERLRKVVVPTRIDGDIRRRESAAQPQPWVFLRPLLYRTLRECHTFPVRRVEKIAAVRNVSVCPHDSVELRKILDQVAKTAEG